MGGNHDLSQVRAAAGRIGGLAKSSRYSPQELTAPARAGFRGRFLKQVDMEFPELPEAERERRAQALLKAHMARLALRSAQARRKGR